MAIRDETHRATLLRDCRYFNFKGLEQKLIAHHISFNQSRGRAEITLRIEDILKSGISVAADDSFQPGQAVPGLSPLGDAASPPVSWVQYARPFADAKPADLILEIGGEATCLHNPPRSSNNNNNNKSNNTNGSRSPRVEFFREARTRIARLFQVIATKMNLPPTTQPLGLLMASGGAGSQPPTPGQTPLSEDRVRVVVGPDAHVVLDGKPFTPPPLRLGAAAASSVSSMAATPAAGAGIAPSMFIPPELDDLGMSPAGYGMPEDSQDSVVSRKRRRLDMYGMAGVGEGGEGMGMGMGVGVETGEGESQPGPETSWIIKTGQWRLMVRGPTGGDKMSAECVLVAVKLEAYSMESTRNASRGFLGGS